MDPGRSVGLYVISLSEGERNFFPTGANTSAAWQLARDPQALADALAGADLIYVPGITLAILEHAGHDILLDAIRAARSKGARVAFDPTLRPRLWTDPRSMTYTVMRASGLCDIA